MGPCDLPGTNRGCELVGDAVGGAAVAAGESNFGSVARAIAEAGEAVLSEVTTAWATIPSGAVTEIDAIRLLQGDLEVITSLVAVLALIVAASKMALTRRGEDMRDAIAGLLRVLVVGAAGITVLTLALEASDVFAAWVLDRATGGQFQPTVVLTDGTLGLGLMFILGLLAIVTGIIQIGLLLVRSTLIVVLAGSWQLAAAASTTPAGSQMWRKITGWLVALVLYKPVAAICYAAAFRLGTGGQGQAAAPSLLATIEGMLLLTLAIVALPAMLRLVVPAVTAIGNVSAASAVAGAAAVASGAVALAGTGGGLGGAFGGSAAISGSGFGEASPRGWSGGASAAPGAAWPAPASPLMSPEFSGRIVASRYDGPTGSRGGPAQGGTAVGDSIVGRSSPPPDVTDPSGTGRDPDSRNTRRPSAADSGASTTGPVVAGSSGVHCAIDDVAKGRGDD